ncbi:MAG: threonine synthase [Acidobacteriota bacterium]|nr:threonine synthase [Acidobacteriota bacterium]
MKYFSTNRRSAQVSFREATLNGQPDDKGLYFPETIPTLSGDFWRDFVEKSKEQIAFEVIKPYVGASIPDETLFQICAETVNFDFPLVPITENIQTLELFHGATLAFKDVGARFMSRCLRYFSREKSEKTIVIVATSGDTGGAVANGFYDVENIEVVILYPKGKVSNVQELQLTTLGKNITALEVAGNFDDCQTLAKTALADEELKRKVFLTSANSINVARWLPQQFYYFYAIQQWQNRVQSPRSKVQSSGFAEIQNPKSKIQNLVICVPSGNFGNICAGILAHVSGLPAKKFIAACNSNDVVPQFLQTGVYSAKSSVATLSNAMDVGNPSNFVRILEIYDNDYLNLSETLESVSVSDEITADTMREVYEKYKYVLDPHGAVGFYALNEYLKANPDDQGIFLETAHPIKFDSVERIIGTYGAMPESVKDLLSRPKQSVEIEVNYEDLKKILLERI